MISFAVLQCSLRYFHPGLSFIYLPAWTETANLATFCVLFSTSLSQSLRSYTSRADRTFRDDTLGRFFASMSVNATSMVASILMYTCSWGGFWRNLYGYALHICVQLSSI